MSSLGWNFSSNEKPLTFVGGASIFITLVFSSKEPLKKKILKGCSKMSGLQKYLWAKTIVDLVGKIHMVN
jgi:hypothetical protein